MFEDLYQEVIIENYKDKSNKREISDGIHKEGYNPSCGDDINLYIKMNKDSIEDISYTGIGCSICLASANMLCNIVRNKDKKYSKELIEKFEKFITGENVIFLNDEEDLEAFEGIKKLPARVKCALLGWDTLKQIII